MAHFILCFGVPNIQQTKVGCAEYSPNIDDKDFYWYWNVKELNKNFFCYLFMTCTLWGPIINCYKINLFSNLKWYISHYLGSVRDKFTSSKAIEKTVATGHSPKGQRFCWKTFPIIWLSSKVWLLRLVGWWIKKCY